MFVIHPFWGLEYEDSYIFSSVSRAININYDFGQDGLYTKYEIFGSFISGSATNTISGHFIFFPLLLSLFNRIFGFYSKNVLVVNSLLSLVNVYYSLKIFRLLNDSKSSQLIFGLLFSTVPFLCIYNSSGLSETFSSVFVIISVYYAFKTKHENYRNKASVIAYVFFICISIFIKRDNLVLIAIPVLEIIVAIFERKTREFITKLFYLLFLIIILISISNFFFDIKRTVDDEMADIGQAPFALNFFKIIFPVFLKSLLKLNFFGISGIIFFISLIFFRHLDSYLTILIIICFGYFAVYSIHYRSYYMVHDNFTPSTIDTFRYFTNFFSILSIFSFHLISVGLKHLSLTRDKLYKWGLFIAVSLNIYWTTILREDLSNDEYEERLLPIKNTLQRIHKDDIIITDRPILFQLFGPKELFVIDITMIDDTKKLKIGDLAKSKKVYVMKDEEKDTRYSNKNKFLNESNLVLIEKLSSHYNLMELQKSE